MPSFFISSATLLAIPILARSTTIMHPGLAFSSRRGRNLSIPRVPSYKVKVVDTTGGGDSFTAGFIHAKYHGYSNEEAVKFASAVAALNIVTPGASTDLPSENDVVEFMKTAEFLEV